MRHILTAVVLAIALFGTARADQPTCTGDRHYDETGQCCPVVTTTTTLPPASCETDEDCTDDNQHCVDGTCVSVCPDPPPCQPVEVTCKIDVCVDGLCGNGSLGTDGAGKCSKDTDCQIVTTVTKTDVHNVFEITVNKCPAQEDLVGCRRTNKGGLVCPNKFIPRREYVPYSRALALEPRHHKGPRLPVPPPGSPR